MVESDVEEKLLIETRSGIGASSPFSTGCTSTGSTPTSHGRCRPVRTRRTSPPQSFSRRVRETFAAMQPFRAAGRYVNYLGDEEGGDPMAAAYGSNYARLQQLKANMNQNITPARREP